MRRSPKVGRHAWLFAVLACIAVFLFTDKSKDTACIHNVFIYGVAVLPHNCDALSMADRLIDLESFYTTYHNWKGRPVYHAYGAIAGSALVPVAYPIWAALYPGVETKSQLRKFSASFSYHFAYFLLNIGVVIACAWIAIRVAGLEIASWPAVALAAAVASSDIVEGGVWLLHTNIFNLVSAFGTLLCVVLGMQRTILTRAGVLWGGFLIGLGVLVYPALSLLAPGYVAGRLIGRLKVENDRTPLAHEFAELLLFVLAVALPVVAWWSANRFVFGTSTYLTADKGHFTWIPKAMAEGKGISYVAWRLAGYYGIVMKHSAAEYYLALGAIAVLTLRYGVGGVRTLLNDPIVWAVLVAMAGVIVFNFLQGYYAPRLHVSAAYLLFVVIARLAAQKGNAIPASFCLFAITGYHLVNAAMTYAASGD
jgi:hypothetical protein